MDVGAANPHVLKLEIAHRGERFIITMHFVRLGGSVDKDLQCTPDSFQDTNSRVTVFVDHEREYPIHDFTPSLLQIFCKKIYA
jgi:hypothetical protein